MKKSSTIKLLLTALIALIGLGFISFQVQVGHITIIIGDKKEVENGGQSQTVVQPVKSVAAEAKTTTVPVTEVSTVSEPASQPVSQSHHVTNARRQSYEAEEEYESEDECVCTCPADEEEGDEGEEAEEEDDGGGLELQAAA